MPGRGPQVLVRDHRTQGGADSVYDDKSDYQAQLYWQRTTLPPAHLQHRRVRLEAELQQAQQPLVEGHHRDVCGGHILQAACRLRLHKCHG